MTEKVSHESLDVCNNIFTSVYVARTSVTYTTPALSPSALLISQCAKLLSRPKIECSKVDVWMNDIEWKRLSSQISCAGHQDCFPVLFSECDIESVILKVPVSLACKLWSSGEFKRLVSKFYWIITHTSLDLVTWNKAKQWTSKGSLFCVPTANANSSPCSIRASSAKSSACGPMLVCDQIRQLSEQVDN